MPEIYAVQEGVVHKESNKLSGEVDVFGSISMET